MSIAPGSIQKRDDPNRLQGWLPCSKTTRSSGNIRFLNVNQPIDPDFYPILQDLVAHRQAIGESHLCEMPLLPSVDWWRFLDGLGLQQLVHHGLRGDMDRLHRETRIV
jgi:hypothetical protein